MINTGLVFILGAGASQPYGLPLGGELLHRIYTASEGPGSDLAQALFQRAQISREKTHEFAHKLRYSSMHSIDAFLARHPELADVGRFAIAYEICRAENRASVFSDQITDNWYRLLWDEMQAGVTAAELIPSNRVRFITFNYDRSLEYFFLQAIKHSFGLEDLEALAIVNRLDILHVYGMVGALSFTHQQGARPYDASIESAPLRIAAEGIKLIPELRHGAAFDTAKTWIREAQKICFLGFGFDQMNIENLGIASILKEPTRISNGMPTIFASHEGLSIAEKDRYNDLVSPHVRWIAAKNKNRDMLRNHRILA